MACDYCKDFHLMASHNISFHFIGATVQEESEFTTSLFLAGKKCTY